MQIKSSKELLEFYEAWYFWATSPVPCEAADYGFSVFHGLCAAAGAWGDYHVSFTLGANIRHEMRKQFLDAGLNVSYPFGEVSYAHDASNGTMHYDRYRLTWVRDRIEEARNAN